MIKKLGTGRMARRNMKTMTESDKKAEGLDNLNRILDGASVRMITRTSPWVVDDSERE